MPMIDPMIFGSKIILVFGRNISNHSRIFPCPNDKKAFLPNTRIIIEPKIIGSIIGIQYINGELNKVINKNSQDITESVRSLKTIPKSLAIKNRLEIQGVLYDNKILSTRKDETEFIDIQNFISQSKRLKFCAFQICQCNINHFQSL